MNALQPRSRRDDDPARPLVLVVAGTRPECIKVASVVRALRERPGVRTLLLSSGQHPAAVRAALAEFGLAPDRELAALPPLPNLAASAQHLRVELAAAMQRLRPAAVIVQGDTLTAYAGACAATDAACEVAHVEAGLRTGSIAQPFPEEWFRRRITRYADWHFAPTADAVRHLHAEGVPPERVHHVGNTGIDSLRAVLAAGASLPAARDARQVLVTLHRRENFDANADTICAALIALADAEPALRVVMPLHPNPRIADRITRRLGAHRAFELTAPMPYRAFVRAVASAGLVISDSGGIQEEAPHLGTPLLVPRTNTERPEALATGFVRLTRVDIGAIVATARAMLAAPFRPPVPIDVRAPFGDGRAGERIAFALEHALGVATLA